MGASGVDFSDINGVDVLDWALATEARSHDLYEGSSHVPLDCGLFLARCDFRPLAHCLKTVAGCPPSGGSATWSGPPFELHRTGDPIGPFAKRRTSLRRLTDDVHHPSDGAHYVAFDVARDGTTRATEDRDYGAAGT